MRYLTYLFPLVLLFVTACGGSENQNQTQESQTATNQSSDVRTINIVGVNQMKYVVKDENQQGITTGTEVGSDGMLELETISAEPGETIRIQLTTQSQMPATSMAHNFILLTLSADVDAFNSAAIKAKDNSYIPSDLTDQIIAQTDLAAGGETVKVTFTVPEETGDYPFICSFPGHYAAGMEGTLNVE
ncbi:plastocyanin/azurin family copper-binding protein [Aliifodinibius sp. S!AR15-10]|uniref:plastocyanin/azurin family copper-binding protein n=1 Tax=Aliifodinibius sp. S!AR15-10 TaxID=2950437 RepID=UPI00286FB367|nr:plastocyanin/azurin family copper-binding protein [Aliifodinibius sp. S!AR15-10]